MISFTQYLSEHILSIGLKDSHDKYREKYRDQILHMLKTAYASIGGYSGLAAGSKEEDAAINDDITNCLIKATVRNDKVTTVTLYKQRAGRKIIACATDGTEQGKADFFKTKTEDHTMERAWAEASGAVEHILKKIGNPVVSSTHAAKLTGKEILRHDADGTHYDRTIGGHVHTKVILGHPKLNDI